MRTTTMYWLWDEKLNKTSFKLGRNIQELEQLNVVFKSIECEEGEYEGMQENPW